MTSEQTVPDAHTKGRKPMTKLTKKERQARDMAATKCWCGNVAGLGQTLCGRHRDPEPSIYDRIEQLEAEVARLRASVLTCLGYWRDEMPTDAVADFQQALQETADD